MLGHRIHCSIPIERSGASRVIGSLRDREPVEITEPLTDRSLSIRSYRWKSIPMEGSGHRDGRSDRLLRAARRPGASRTTRRPPSPGIFRALADPHWRRRCVNLLATSREPVCACEHLTSRSDSSQPTVSHHLKKLTDAGLLEREQRGKWAYFSLKRDAVKKLAISRRPERSVLLMSTTADELREEVRRRYAESARAVADGFRRVRLGERLLLRRRRRRDVSTTSARRSTTPNSAASSPTQRCSPPWVAATPPPSPTCAKARRSWTWLRRRDRRDPVGPAGRPDRGRRTDST